MGLTTGFKNSAGKDIGSDLVEKSYLIDRYPELADTFRFAGLLVWGSNGFAALGDNTATDKSSPVQTIAAGANWKMLSFGSFHTAAIKTNGTLWTWGYNTNGHLGDNTVATKSSPVQTIAGGTNWKMVSLGANYTTAIKTDGTLWAWGRNTNGQLGDNTATDKSSPVQTIAGGTNWKQVSAGGNSTVGIKTDGTLWLWGAGGIGQLGDNTVVSKSSPVQTVAGGTNWKQASISNNNAAAIKTDGTLWTWGLNSGGQLGTNTTTGRSSPGQTIAAGTNWKQVASDSETAAIKTDGTLWTWGLNTSGNLGDNTIVHRSSPVQTIAGGTNWKQLSAANSGIGAIKTDGTLWVWGGNLSGQLGDNTATNKSSPVQTIAGGTNWKLVNMSISNAGAIRDNSSDIFGESV